MSEEEDYADYDLLPDRPPAYRVLLVVAALAFVIGAWAVALRR